MNKYVIATYTTEETNPKTYLKYWYLLAGEGLNWFKKENKKDTVIVREYPDYETAQKEVANEFKYRTKEE